MTVELTTNLRAFIRRMTENDEQAQWGYELLLKRENFDEYFDHLKEAGLFGVEHNPGPQPADQPGYVHIPYWHALDYLQAVAKRAGETNDVQLAGKVIGVIREVTEASETDGSRRENYHTCRTFAEILGQVPTAAVTPEVLNQIPTWLKGKYDRGMVCHALDHGLMRRLLASDSADDWNKAVSILQHCTGIIWVDEEALGGSRKKPVTNVEDHSLKEFIANHAEELGKKAGQPAAEVFVRRLRETYDLSKRDLPSWIHRPAIEDHVQNHDWMGPENRFVEGLREVLLSWVDFDKSSAQAFVERLIGDEMAVLRRIAVYVIDKRWAKLKQVLSAGFLPRLFDDELLHEAHGLLQRHFETLEDAGKAAIIEAIKRLGEPFEDEEENRRILRIKREWLLIVAGKGYGPADKLLNDLNSDQSLGPFLEHPDFHSYMESWVGHGPAPYQPQELIVFAENGTLIERLNDFQEKDSWRGPTTRALVDSLEASIALSPGSFLSILKDFGNARRPFQYGVISGFKEIWSKSGPEGQQFDWDKAWPDIILFFERLISSQAFWSEQVPENQNLTPNKNWIPPIIAEFLRSGTTDDRKVYPAGLLPRTWALLLVLLDKLNWQGEPPKSDSMTQAINSSRGKVIEAVFSQALRVCRIRDREVGQHADEWASMKTVFEQELDRCRNANYEFSTLAGSYLSQLDYIDRDWLRANLVKIFPSDYHENFICAIGGLAYANITRPLYGFLVENRIPEIALSLQIEDRRVIERLVERIALAYLWGDERLDSIRFQCLFKVGQSDAIEDAIDWFWSIRNQSLSSTQVELILKFWERCISWAGTLEVLPSRLFSSLSRLACYINLVDERGRSLLLAVAPYVHLAHYSHFFHEELDRLADTQVEQISAILKASLDKHLPHNDFEGRLKSIISKLAGCGLREDAIVLADKLKQIPGMVDTYKSLLGKSY